MGIVFVVLALALGSIFVAVARRSLSDTPFEEIQPRAYWFRKRWLAFLLALLVVVVGIAALLVPYSGGATGRTVVKVKGGQFFWSLDPPQVAAGTRVRFDVTAVDVNHGFGLYDPRGRLLGSVQAMPGYHNELDLTLDRPGTYRILCFEFCGLNHHLMQGTFTVTPR